MNGGRPTIVVTRPEPEARALADILGARGADALAAPMLEVEAVTPEAIDLSGVQAVLLTSANAVRHLPAIEGLTALPAFAVGDATAGAARGARFGTVISAQADAEALAALVAERLSPSDGAVLHLSGADVARDLGTILGPRGFTVKRVAVYAARPATALPEDVRMALSDGAVDGVLFFSPRSAATFVSLASRAGLASGCREAVALCLSTSVAAATRVLAWRDVRSAAHPTADAMMALVAETFPTTARFTLRDTKASMSKAPKDAKDKQSADSGGKKKAKKGEDAARGAASVPATGKGPSAAESTKPAETPPVTVGEKAASATDGSRRQDAPPAAATPARDGPKPAGGTTPEPATAARSAPAGAPADGSFGRKLAIAGATLAAVLLVVAVAGALVATRYYWEPPVTAQFRQWFGGDQPDQSLAGLRERVAALESAGEVPEIGELRDRGTALSERMADIVGRVDGLDQSLQELRGRVESADAGQLQDLRRSLTQRLEQLEQQTAEARQAGSDRLDALEREKNDLLARLQTVADRLGALEAQVKQQADRLSRPSALVIAVSQLRRAVESGAGFAEPLTAVDRLSDERPAVGRHVDALRDLADGGVPTLAALRRRFDDQVARPVFAADGDGSGGWLDRMVDQIGSIVSIRRTDSVVGETPDAIVTRAQAHLAAGDLGAAVAELRTLPDPLRQAAEPWLSDAGRRLQALDAVRAMESALLSGQATGG